MEYKIVDTPTGKRIMEKYGKKWQYVPLDNHLETIIKERKELYKNLGQEYVNYETITTQSHQP